MVKRNCSAFIYVYLRNLEEIATVAVIVWLNSYTDKSKTKLVKDEKKDWLVQESDHKYKFLLSKEEEKSCRKQERKKTLAFTKIFNIVKIFWDKI